VSTATFLAVSGITEAGPPRVLDDVVVFTYEQNDYARYVAIAFEHENYQHRHVFTARRRDDRPDLYYLVYPVDVERDSLTYRLIVDGVWLTDPHAPQIRADRNGVTVGSVELNEPPPYERISPQIHADVLLCNQLPRVTYPGDGGLAAAQHFRLPGTARFGGGYV
jgi:hypothetical protein